MKRIIPCWSLEIKGYYLNKFSNITCDPADSAVFGIKWQNPGMYSSLTTKEVGIPDDRRELRDLHTETVDSGQVPHTAPLWSE